MNMPISTADRQAIEDFITSAELVQLETRFARFNIFEALAVERRELNHSSFLAFLLDPFGSHGLRDLFLRRFLQDVAKSSDSLPIVSAVDLDLMDFMQTEVRREHKNIDIFLRDPLNKLIVIVENKVGSKQHSNQLDRYYEFSRKEFPDHRLLAIFLTPDGDDPNHPSYIGFTYEKVRSLVLEVLSRESVLINSSVRSSLEQYADLLGRRFMADSELKQLCGSIYKRHKQAIDILIANIPDERGVLATFLRELITSSGFILDDSNNNMVRFIPPELDLPYFRGASGWTSSGRLILFEFRLRADSIQLILQMGPGDNVRRINVHQFALKNKPLFCAEKTQYEKWQRLYAKPFLEANNYELDTEAQGELLKKKWNEFLHSDLPVISQRFLGEKSFEL